MSLLVTYRDGRPSHGVPLASLAGFREDWLPLARQKGLQWVPLFETGVPITRDGEPSVAGQVLAELAALRDCVEQNADRLGEAGSGHLIGRLDAVRAALDAALADPAAEAWIGS